LSLFALIASFGGFLSFIRALCNSLLKDMQTFSLDNSMIKKLFTKMTREEEKHEDTGDFFRSTDTAHLL